MHPRHFSRVRIAVSACLCALLLLAYNGFARVGGAGGHSSHSSGSRSSGGHSYSSHSSGYSSGSASSGGSFGMGGIIALIVIAIIVYVVIQKMKGGTNNLLDNGPDNSYRPSKPFPAGLDEEKVREAFLGIQDAWQRKDLKGVRKWLSDGMYQRLTAQFRMMQVLGQSNRLSNIRIGSITVDEVRADNDYQTAEVAISFMMDDSFTSDKYPQFNEEFSGDTATEYWTFIKRADAEADKNLYDNNNCPNCGAPFEQKLGEISRCSNCGTLTNSAAYDWVLSEITQEDDYSGGAGLSSDAGLKTLMTGDDYFAVQRVEDIASNIFMQIMEVLTGRDDEKLARFADEKTEQAILQQKKSLQPFVFDRIYLNYVTLSGYQTANDLVYLRFDLAATFRRVSIAKGIQVLDNDFVTRRFGMTLARKAAPAKAAAGETVFSYECSNCAAPFTDTTKDRCDYCDALVVDTERNWVLTDFSWS